MNATLLIEKWFADHDGDGEFAYHPRTSYRVLSPISDAARLVFTTKERPVSLSISECDQCTGFGMIARYGLPRDSDMSWIAEIVGNHQAFFLGDMDPVDLMIFAWIRGRLHPKPITFLGVSDSYLNALNLSLPPSFIMKCAPSELESRPLLERVFPDFREIVGPKCSLALMQGQKIELDAVVSALGAATRVLLPAIDKSL